MGSVIAAAVEAGADVTVCCATRGEAGEARGVDAGADLGAVREGELRAAGAVLGVSRFVLLGYRDSGMDGDLATGTLAAAPLAEVAARLQEVLDDVDPDVVVTLDADYGDGHRDHAAIGRATVEACRDRSGIRVYAWTVVRSIVARWLAHLQQVRPESAYLEADRQALGRPEDEVTTVLDVAHQATTRERAAALHASQVSPFENMPVDLRTDFVSTDRLVRLQPVWAGGDVERSIFPVP